MNNWYGNVNIFSLVPNPIQQNVHGNHTLEGRWICLIIAFKQTNFNPTKKMYTFTMNGITMNGVTMNGVCDS